MWRGVVFVALVGCSERIAGADPTWETGAVEPEDEGTLATADASACGATYEDDFVVSGILVRPDGTPVPSAEVWLEQRDWGPLTVHGDGWTDASGRFSFSAVDVPIVEGCWAIGPQFYVAALLGELYAEDGANMEIVQAWLDGTHEAALYQPLVTEL
jgi:hypothetical protein